MQVAPLVPLAAAVVAVVAGGSAVVAEPAEVFTPGFADPAAAPPKPELPAGTAMRFVTAPDYPPFDVAQADGSVSGFNVDLARALCDELGLACTIQARPWADLVPALLGREADAVIASQKITAAARREVAFTRPYYRTPARFLQRVGTAQGVPTAAGLGGRSVAVVAGTAQDAYLRTFFPGAKPAPFPTAAAARAALKDGKADLLFDDGIGAALWLGSDEAAGCCAFWGGPYTESRFFGEGAGIALRPGDTALRRALDYALVKVTAKGVYADLYLKWFPIGFY